MTTTETDPLDGDLTSTLAKETAPKESFLKRIASFEITPQRVKRRDLMHFSRQMAVFIKAGIPTFIRRPRGRDIYAACGQLKLSQE